MDKLLNPEYAQLIFQFRGMKVMVDTDLAVLYGTSTKALKQQVKRNLGRFPADFMFELTLEEKNELVTNCDRFHALKHSSVNPMVFTEQGVAMLSSVLRSEKVNSIFQYLLAKIDALHEKQNQSRERIGFKPDKI